ncbi:alanine--tRNA ligase [Carnobacteriaceae bacterium zg-84]|uniref:alanine--tRNA ligase n=1 Tax=Granulicatella sp. zg-84 TaxID=2678503 RepID=UPI0013C0663E|nr:alanine--tRNA ligase [Granulicatella sp. zg-84]NEW66280.1 alanine--tRNA ligase [Granulicatella sp. zg-84]QMI85632.1 alanine--tRNA ligase [Carnobacteriaceae bacterium zg-84]
MVLTSKEIRQKYLDFFASKQHEIIPSASLIPVNDPTLLWINAGVAPLKKYFDGTEVPNTPRLANAQKCIRTNDIENVGVTARHHTLFEMLGNWSIGEYFKEEAISWAWEFLTDEKWLGFEPEKLYATYYPEDTETPNIWKKQPNFDGSHLVPFEDNFWDIGAGPCGPCTEIFYDRGEKYLDIPEDDPENYPGGENERYLEIWNLVFSEFNHMPDDTYQPLPRKNIDTGMGLERVTSVLQDTPTNFETDLFKPIIDKIGTLTSIQYGDNKTTDTSFKVIADHVRAVSFAIGDGALPSNEGRGYILRRLIRRSVMHGQKLGIHHTFMKDLVPVVAEIMGAFYPEIVEKTAFIQKVIGSEEEKFHETINGGLELLQHIFKNMDENKETVVSGREAFKLYDTYGFPLELTQEYASEHQFTVNTEEFDIAMNEQRERARAARQKEESMAIQSEVYTSIHVPSEFVGYQTHEAIGELNAIVCHNEQVDNVDAEQYANVFFSTTPFYAEMGGQVADTGVVETMDGQVVAIVENVKKAPNGQPMHSVKVVLPLHVGTQYKLVVDKARRRKITNNHTATHLLHKALKDVLGTHANQAGSYVSPTYLRFDFTHFGQVTPEELKQMERIVNEKIWEALDVVTIETDVDTAKSMGAMALFGEKYGKVVRVVNIGGYSIELCGGIHVGNTQEIGLFQIVSESGIGAGTRRIEAVTSQEAYELLNSFERTLVDTAKTVKSSVMDVPTRVGQLLQEQKELRSELESLKAKLLKQESNALFDNVQVYHDLRIIAVETPNKDMNALRGLADTWKEKDSSDVFVVATVQDDKVNLLVAANKKANEKGVKAGDLIKQIAPLVAGGGGGRPDMAQAGGKNPAGVKDALAKVIELLK